ncbi:hypothetical protein PRIPAC_72892 [Pristionchus pacificus]|uniref:Uncharacterized protein n=1 Tax=Pristionchus pacificus TaxID=54126 RepID=A0A2A6C6B4_PRIPA|nr:hypothetical protein PRIPAC_72892 [Pristionchus pacificus]|eukprot:PDM73715.1 hypothetical protein PRIPAC_41071 [Pristionchus pacificus]
MNRLLLILSAVFAGVFSDVYTCNEIKKMLDTGGEFFGDRACVVIPASAQMTDEPYSAFKEIDESGTFCTNGLGPWFIMSDNPNQPFECSGGKYTYAEIFLIITSEEPNIVQIGTAPTTTTFGKGTHVFVAPEGSLLIDKKSIDEGKETTLQWYTGAGASEREERYALMPEQFIAGTSSVIIGPVTALILEDDVNVELTLTSFQDKQFLSANPGFSFTLMSSGRASDLQSSRPSILISTAYGINDETIAYDSISITGTAKMDDEVHTTLSIECYNHETDTKKTDDITTTRDVIINDDCSSLDITYKGTLAPDAIFRSSEVIYLKIEANSNPVLKGSTKAPNTGATDPPKPSGPVTNAPDVVTSAFPVVDDGSLDAVVGEAVECVVFCEVIVGGALDMPLVKLTSKENEEFKVDLKVAKLSATIASLMEALNMTDDAEEDVFENNAIPLPNVAKEELERVITWCEHHKDDAPKVELEDDGKKGRKEHIVPDWDKQFLKYVDNDSMAMLVPLMMAANYLEIKGLFENISQTIANEIHGLKRDQIAAKFHIKCDLTEEEIAQIRKDNAWCEE